MFNKNNKLILFLIAFFFAFGIVSSVYVILNLINPDLFTVRFLWAFGLYILVASFAGTLVFKTGVSVRSLWIRRAIMAGIICITFPAVNILTGTSEYSSLSQFLKYEAVFTILLIILVIISYIVADKLENNMLKKINEKLKHNDTNE